MKPATPGCSPGGNPGFFRGGRRRISGGLPWPPWLASLSPAATPPPAEKIRGSTLPNWPQSCTEQRWILLPELRLQWTGCSRRGRRCRAGAGPPPRSAGLAAAHSVAGAAPHDESSGTTAPRSPRALMSHLGRPPLGRPTGRFRANGTQSEARGEVHELACGCKGGGGGGGEYGGGSINQQRSGRKQ